MFLLIVGYAAGQEQPDSKSGAQDFGSIVIAASAALESGEVGRAVELYSRAEVLDPQWTEGWWKLGMLQYQTHAYPAAIDAFTHMIALSPSAATAFALRGLCEFETEDYADSLSDIERGVELGAANGSKNAGILKFHQALLLTRSGRFDESIRIYEQLASDTEPNEEMKVGLGLAGLRVAMLPSDATADQDRLFSMAGEAAFQWMTGDERGSAQAFASLFHQYPSTPNAHFLYGYLRMTKDPRGSIAEFRRELEIVPGNATAASSLAWVLLLEEKPTDALPYAEEAETAQPALPSSEFVLGESLAETGDLRDGIEHLQRALQLDSENFLAHIALATALSRAGREEDAWRERQLAVQMAKTAGSTFAHP